MSKNHYLNLNKNDILFVNNGKDPVAMYLFDGASFNELVLAKENNLTSSVDITQIDYRTFVENKSKK